MAERPYSRVYAPTSASCRVKTPKSEPSNAPSIRFSESWSLAGGRESVCYDRRVTYASQPHGRTTKSQRTTDTTVLPPACLLSSSVSTPRHSLPQTVICTWLLEPPNTYYAGILFDFALCPSLQIERLDGPRSRWLDSCFPATFFVRVCGKE